MEKVRRAQAAYDKGEHAVAAVLFEEEASALSTNGDSLQAAEMMNNASVAWLKAGNTERAYQACQGTDQLFASAGDFRRQAIALANQAAALEAMGQLQQAEEKYVLSADLFRQSGDADMRAYVYQSLSTLQVRMGRQLEAVASMNAALELKKKKSLKEKLLHKLLGTPFRMMK